MCNFILFLLGAILLTQASIVQNANIGYEYPGQRVIHPIFKNYRLCTFTIEAYEKCQETVKAAKSRYLDLPLRCILKDTRNECIISINRRFADLVVLTGHNYQIGRHAGLKPIIFERDSNEDYYIAVAPRNITVIDINEAPIIVDQSNHRAVHAAIFFNLRRGHDVCPLYNQVRDDVYVKIVNSAKYVANDDEILLCPDRSWAYAESSEECNFEASLQRAVFVDNRMPQSVISRLKRAVFDVIIKEFGHQSSNEIPTTNHFNFFATFKGKENVIFKSNAIGFDLYPTYRNGVTEEISNSLHCNADIGNHDSSQLE